MVFMHPGMVCHKKTWVVMDHVNKVVWLYHVDGSMFVICDL